MKSPPAPDLETEPAAADPREAGARPQPRQRSAFTEGSRSGQTSTFWICNRKSKSPRAEKGERGEERTAAMSYIIRPWALRDLKDLVRLIQEAAAFHKALDQVKTTPKALREDGLRTHPKFGCLVEEVPPEQRSKEGHTIVGYQFHYSSYCTWERWILFGEDLYVMPEFRGRGIGTSLLNQVAKIALASGYTQFRFMSANWNQPATAFYENLGAVNVSARDSWNVWHMEGQRKIAAWVTQ
nr:diamine acetyltransferase 1-like [Pelodiscus sinensis]|eukprot:XP_025043947.1 diamine acetyltransferase 1-like [Pelodiscus sinensis]